MISYISSTVISLGTGYGFFNSELSIPKGIGEGAIGVSSPMKSYNVNLPACEI